MIEHEFLINNDNISSQEMDAIKCPICLNIFVNPIACGNCQNHFC